MLQNLYTIHDITADHYHAPFVQPNDESACRFFSEQINAGDSNLQRYPDHYRLIRIGTFATDSGSVTDTQHAQLGTARNFLVNRHTPEGQNEIEQAICHRALMQKYFSPEELAEMDKISIGPEQLKELECRIRGRQEAATDQNDIDIEETLNPKADLSNEAQLPKTAKKPPKGE